MSLFDGFFSEMDKLKAGVSKVPSFMLGEVTQVSPVKVKPDFHTVPLAGRAMNFAGALSVGDRVLILRFGRRIAVIGKAGGYPPQDYSLTEQDTGLKWVDGKPIYRRTFTGTITQAAASRNATLLDSTQTFSAVISITGTVHTGIYPMVAGTYDTQGWSAALINAAKRLELVSQSPNARSAAPYSVCVEYTKE